MNPSSICLEQREELLTGSKYVCPLSDKKTFMRKCAVPIPALFAPNLRASITGWGTHTPNNRAHVKSEELSNERRLKENGCILGGEP